MKIPRRPSSPAQWVVPVDPVGTLTDHARRRAGRPDPRGAARRTRASGPLAPQGKTLALARHATDSGLVNLHAPRAAMSLLPRLCRRPALMTWLNERIWPAEKNHVSDAFVRDGTLLAARRDALGGSTTCNDMYFFPQAAGEAFLQAGMRATLGMIVLEFPAPTRRMPTTTWPSALRDDPQGEPLLTSPSPRTRPTHFRCHVRRINTLTEQLACPSTPTSTKPPTKSVTASTICDVR